MVYREQCGGQEDAPARPEGQGEAAEVKEYAAQGGPGEEKIEIRKEIVFKFKNISFKIKEFFKFYFKNISFTIYHLK